MPLYCHFKNKFFLILFFLIPILITPSVSEALFSKTPAPIIQVQISGVPEDIQTTLNNALSISSIKTQTDIQNPAHVQLLYERSIQQILTVLKSNGYYKATIDSHLEAHPEKNHWIASYAVKLGDPLRIKTIQFTILGDGERNLALNKIYQKSDLHPGKILNQSHYEALKTDLLNQAIALGFFDAEIAEHQIRINLNKNQADIVLTLQTSTRYHFGKTTFSQEGFAFESKFLERYLTYQTGQPYQASLIEALQSHLANTEYFSDISVKPTPNSATHSVDVLIKTTTQKKIKYTLGLGYGTETGPRITLGSDIRYVNSRGDYLTLAVQASRIYQEVVASYVIPGKNPVTDYTSINAGENYTDITPYTATTTLAGMDWGSVRGHWTRTLGLHENWVHYDTPVSNTDRAAYLLPRAELYYQYPINNGFFTNGFNTDIATTGTVQSFASQSTFIKSILTTRYAIGLSTDNRLFFRAQAGAIGTHSLTDLSPTIRFYTGGIGSIRGYQYSSLSPEDSNGNLTGGRYLLVGSINFEQRLYGKLSGLVFYDAGNAFNKLNGVQWAQGAGLGFAYQSPVGPIQFYFSHPVDLPDSHWRVDFSVGSFI